MSRPPLLFSHCAYTNGPIDSGDWVSLDIGLPREASAKWGTVTGTQLTVTVTYTVDAQ